MALPVQVPFLGQNYIAFAIIYVTSMKNINYSAKMHLILHVTFNNKIIGSDLKNIPLKSLTHCCAVIYYKIFLKMAPQEWRTWKRSCNFFLSSYVLQKNQQLLLKIYKWTLKKGALKSPQKCNWGEPNFLPLFFFRTDQPKRGLRIVKKIFWKCWF